MKTLISVTISLFFCSCATVPSSQLTAKQIVARENQQSVWSKIGQSAAQMFINLGLNYMAPEGEIVGFKK